MTNERFTVINHDYINTGGNTMVSIFSVYDHTDNVSRYVIANDEGFNWQTADTISNCDFTLDNDEMIKKIVIGSWKWDALTSSPCWDQHQFEDEEWALFKYCQFEFYKEDCKYFGTKVRLSIEELPNDLHSKLSEDYIKWANEEGTGCLTDGYEVYMDADYEPPVKEDCKDLADMKEFYRWFNNLQYNDTLRDNTSYITVAVAGNSVKIPFHADTYELLDRFLTKAIEEF